MSDPTVPPRFPSWVAPTVVTLLTFQLALLWLQGGLLHRQHQDLQDLKADVQSMAEALDQNLVQDPETELSFAPTRAHLRPSRRPLQRVRMLRMLQETPSPTPAEEEKTRKELDATRDSARKAVADAREVQSKLSIEENYRKAEEKKKVEVVQNTWQKWLWATLGLGLLAVVMRAWLRRRG